MSKSKVIHELSMQELASLNGELLSARAHLELGLKQATDFYRRLSWLLCGIAHHDEAVARTCALQARSSFCQGPRRESHHWRTWQAFRHGSTIAEHMDLFIDGAPRAELHGLWKEAAPDTIANTV